MTPEESIQECQLLFQNNNFYSAKKLATDLVANNPKCELSLRLLFEGFIKFGEEVSAQKVLKTLICHGALFSKEAEIMRSFKNAKRQVYEIYKEGNYEECLKILKTAIEISPCSVEFQLKKAQCLINMKMPRIAFPVIDKVLAENSENTFALHLKSLAKYHVGQMEESYELLKEVLKLDPDNERLMTFKTKLKSFLAPYRKAKELCEAGKFEAAIAILQEEILIHHRHKDWVTELRLFSAKVHYAILEFQKAIVDLNFVINNATKSCEEMFALRAECFLNIGEFDKCIDDCNLSLEIKQNEFVSKMREEALEKKIEEKLFNKLVMASLENLSHFKEFPDKPENFTQAIRSLLYLGDTEKVTNLITENSDNLDLLKLAQNQLQEFKTSSTVTESSSSSTFTSDKNLIDLVLHLIASKEKEDFSRKLS